MTRPSPWVRRARWLPSLLLATLATALVLTRGLANVPAAAYTPAEPGQASPGASPATGVHAHGSNAVGVPLQLSDQPGGVAYCASASLEPFEGALAQLRANGPDEAVERLRWCLMETVFGHTDAATEESLRELLPLFNVCYRALADAIIPTKQQASGQIAACVLSPNQR